MEGCQACVPGHGANITGLPFHTATEQATGEPAGAGDSDILRPPQLAPLPSRSPSPAVRGSSWGLGNPEPQDTDLVAQAGRALQEGLARVLIDNKSPRLGGHGARLRGLGRGAGAGQLGGLRRRQQLLQTVKGLLVLLGRGQIVVGTGLGPLSDSPDGHLSQKQQHTRVRQAGGGPFLAFVWGRGEGGRGLELH